MIKICKPLLLSALSKQRDSLGNHKHTSIGGRAAVLLLPEDLVSAELCL